MTSPLQFLRPRKWLTTATPSSPAAAGVLLMLVAGCASADSFTYPRSGSPSAGAPSTAASPASPRAVAVTYRQTGGEEAMDRRYRLTVGEPPPAGFSRVEVKAALEAASDPSLRSLEMPPLPEDPCCDFYLYVVTISWADGTSRTYKSFSGDEPQPTFDRLIDRLP